MKKFISCVFLVILSIFIGCVVKLTPHHYVNHYHHEGGPLKVMSIYIDKDFGEGDLIAMDNAIKQWNHALNGYIELRVVSTKFDMEPSRIKECRDGGCWIILKIDSTSPMVHDAGKLWKTYAFCDQVGGYVMYIIRDRIGSGDVYGITMHELGHLLGSGHASSGLMYYAYNRDDCQCVDEHAIMNVAEYHNLPEERLNYCVEGELK